METRIAIFKGNKIRKTIHKNEWWFVIVDVVAVLTDSVQPGGYIKDMRKRDLELSKGWGANCHPPFNRNYRRASKVKLCQYRRHLSYYPVNSFKEIAVNKDTRDL